MNTCITEYSLSCALYEWVKNVKEWKAKNQIDPKDCEPPASVFAFQAST